MVDGARDAVKALHKQRHTLKVFGVYLVANTVVNLNILSFIVYVAM